MTTTFLEAEPGIGIRSGGFCNRLKSKPSASLAGLHRSGGISSSIWLVSNRIPYITVDWHTLFVCFCFQEPSASDGSRESAEYRSFKKHFEDLFRSIQEPIALSMRLFNAGLLHTETRISICSLEQMPSLQRSKLLDAVEGQIIVDPQSFYKFVNELEKDRPMQHLCDKLRFTCGKCDNVCLSIVTD